MITPPLQRTSLVALVLTTLLGCSEDAPQEPDKRAPDMQAPATQAPETLDSRPVAAPDYDLNPAYLSFRETAFAVEATTLDVPADTEVLALLMETGSADYVYTLALFADGATSLYFSNGGGTIGAGAFNGIDESTRGVIDLTAKYVHMLTDADDQQLPTPGNVRMHVRTPAGWKMLEAPEEMLGSDSHPASELFHACHDVVSEVLAIGR